MTTAISGLGATSATTTPPAASTSAVSRLNANFDTFIKLLTEQLKNQDPLEPMDTEKFTQQLVMYSQVEQQIGTNEKLDKLIGQSSNSIAGQYLNYIGREIVAKEDKLILQQGQNASLRYDLPAAAERVRVEILNSQGNLVQIIDSPAKARGMNQITWDGRTQGGTTAAPGVYAYRVTGFDATGKDIGSVQEYLIGRVNGVVTSTNGAELDVGGLMLNPTKVLSVRELAAGA